MINIPNNIQPVEDNGMIKPEWNTFFQQIKTVIKTDYAIDIGLPNVLEPIVDENKNITFFQEGKVTIIITNKDIGGIK